MGEALVVDGARSAIGDFRGRLAALGAADLGKIIAA